MIGRPSTVAGSLGLLSLLLALGCADLPERDPGQPYYVLADHLQIATVERDETQQGAPSATADGSLSLPAGSSVSFALFLQADSSLQAATVEFTGRGTQLEIEIETDRDGRQSLKGLRRSTSDFGVDLPSDGETPARLTLRASGDPDGAAIVTGAALWSPEPHSAGEELAVEVATSDSADRPPNVLIYLIDTLRRDRLGCYGYERPLTPNLDEFASQATLFTDAVAQSTWTKASVASMFSGVWPPAHGATGWKHKLPLRFDTLAEVLQDGGYRTAAVSGNPNIVEHYDLDQGFETFFTQLKQTSVEINETVFKWLAELDPADPYFLYVHTMDPHAPYNPPEPFRSRFAPNADQIPTWTPRWRWPVEALPYLDALYDADIAFNDHSFGELIAELERRKTYDDTMIVVLSDHGEEFREHGKWRHGNNLFPPTMNVPLIIKYPGQRQPSRVDATTQHLDLMPTILDTVGLPVPAVAGGRRIIYETGPEGTLAVPPAPIFSHLRLGRSPLVHSIIDGPWKLVTSETIDSRSVALFHRRDDPEEKTDLAAELPIRAAALEAVLAQEILGGEPPPPAEEAVLDEAMKRDLEALGYLE